MGGGDGEGVVLEAVDGLGDEEGSFPFGGGEGLFVEVAGVLRKHHQPIPRQIIHRPIRISPSKPPNQDFPRHFNHLLQAHKIRIRVQNHLHQRIQPVFLLGPLEPDIPRKDA